MLKKVLKHDMRAMMRSTVPMFIVMGVVSVVCCVILYFTYNFETEVESMIAAVLLVGGFLVMGIFAIAAMLVVVSVLTYVRYYKSLFTDEGYLTMVLPMETTTLLHAKLLFALIWGAIGAAATFTGLFVALILPTLLYDKEVLTGTIEVIRSLFSLFTGEPYMSAILPIQIVALFVRSVESVFLTVASITVGAAVMKRRKILGAILFYFGGTFIRENVVSIFEIIIDAILVETAGNLGIIIAGIFGIVISTAIILASYFTCRHILNKKFNIE